MDAKALLTQEDQQSSSSRTPPSSSQTMTMTGPTSTITSSSAASTKSSSLRTQGTIIEQRGRSVSLNLAEEMDHEYDTNIHHHNNQRQSKSSNVRSTMAKSIKENFHPNNMVAMKKIMRRKQMANAARNELDHSGINISSQSKEIEESASLYNNNNPAEASIEEEENTNDNDNNEFVTAIMNNSTSNNSWAMMGNHYLNETTMDHIDGSMGMGLSLTSTDLAISPAQWKKHHQEQTNEGNANGNGDVQSELSSSSGGGIGGAGSSLAMSGVSGVSGVLSFLGESPLFDIDQTLTAEENEAEKNLVRSAEKVKRLEEHLLRSATDGAGGMMMLSPVQPRKMMEDGGAINNDKSNDGNMGRERGVTFAIQGGWETPRGSIPHYSPYAKSPYVTGGGGMMMTPSKMTPSKLLSESMEAQVNPMNESVIVSDGSDDDESGDNNHAEPSPLKGIGSEDELLLDDDEGSNFDHYETPECSVEVNSTSGASKASGTEEQHLQQQARGKKNASKDITPTRASLMERNQTLVKEVRFADQTCVELSERKKYYKTQASQFKKTLEASKRENSLLHENYEASLQETAKLKVLVESFQAQKSQADMQVEAYRAQISESEKTHQTNMERMESTYHSHLRNSEEQMFALNERLEQSLNDNSSLQSKLDEVHSKWEYKLTNGDASSKELIDSLKDRVAAGDATASSADASVQALKARLVDLQKMGNEHKVEFQKERNAREMIEHDRDDLQAQCHDLHRQLTEWVQTSDTLGDVFFNDDGSQNKDFVESLKDFTPVKQLALDSSEDCHMQARTPTSNLLARTLRSELKHRQSVSDKLERADKKVSKLKDKIANMKMDVEEAKADNALLEEDLDEKCILVAELKEELGDKDDEISRLHEEIDLLVHAEGGASTSDMESSATASRSEASSKQEYRGDTVSVLEERLDAVEETLEYTDDELTEAKAKLANSQELLDQTSAELERAEEALSEARDEVSDHKAQVENLLEALEDKNKESAKISKFSDFQSSTLGALKAKVSRSDINNAELRLQLSSCFQSLVALHKILRTYEDMDGIVGKKMTEQSEKVGRLLETLEQFVQERGSAPARDLESGLLAATDEQMSASEPGMESLSSFASTPACTRCPTYQQQLEMLRNEFASVELEHNDVSENLDRAQRVIQEFKDELTKQESEHRQETTYLKKQCVELEAKLSAVSESLKECEKEKKSLSKSSSSTENAVSQQLSVIRKNNAELITENQNLRVNLEGIGFQLENERSLLRSAREEADGHRQNSKNAKAAFECLTYECELTKASLSKLETEALGLREAASKKEKELKECQENKTKVQALFQEEIESLESRCDGLSANLSEEGQGRLRAVASLDDASKQIASLEHAIQVNEEECEEKQSECQELLIQLQQVQSALVEAEKEKSQADGTIERLESELQDQKSVLFSYEESIIKYKDDIRKLQNELQTTISEKNSRIQMLEQGLHSRQTLFAEQLDRTKMERDESTAELTGMIGRLQNELTASNKLHQESTERANLAMQELEDEVLEQNEAQRELEEEIIRGQASLDEETKKYEDACKDLELAQQEMAQINDKLNSFEMDRERTSMKHQDEVEELLEETHRLEDVKNQLEEQM